MEKKHHLIQFVCIAFVFVVLLLQGLTHWVKVKPLKGYENAEEQPVALNFDTYWDGTYQEYLTDHARRNTGFREFFIRSYNQMAYSCFRIITNDNVVEGADRELFLKMYLDDLTGRSLSAHYDDVAEAKADARKNVMETLRLIDTLQAHGTQFLFLFAPTKPAVYPEKVPQPYCDQVSEFSLEEYYLELFKEYGIPHIDFLNYFKAVRDTSAYPLYTRTGTHWARFTLPWVADTVYRKLESLTEYHFPKVKVIDNNLTKRYTSMDLELEGNMNLLFPYPKPELPVPIMVLTDTLESDRPNLLVIGDSYGNLLTSRNPPSVFTQAFHNWDFWIYNQKIYSSRERYNWHQLNREFQAWRVLEEADIVLAVFTAPMYYNFMFEFPRTAQELYAKGYFNEEEALDIVTEIILRDSLWYSQVERQAEIRNITIEEALEINAKYWLCHLKDGYN